MVHEAGAREADAGTDIVNDGEASKVTYATGLLLQFGWPDLASRHMFGGSAADFDKQSELDVEALNHATRDILPDRLRVHLCRGNYEGPHHHAVPFADIIDVTLKAYPPARLFEAANPRHAPEWRVFDDIRLPEGKVLMPGVIDTTTNYIEHPRLAADRIVSFAAVVGRENVIAGTDCGFETFANFLTVGPAVLGPRSAHSSNDPSSRRESFGREELH